MMTMKMKMILYKSSARPTKYNRKKRKAIRKRKEKFRKKNGR